MKVSVAAVLAVVAGVAQAKLYGNVTITTEIVTEVVTYCPEATEVVYGGTTYTVTEATTLTITDCPCTITKPVTVSSSVYCNTCSTGYSNSTTSATSVGSVTAPAPTTTSKTIPTGAAGKVGLTGGALAGVLGLAVFVL